MSRVEKLCYALEVDIGQEFKDGSGETHKIELDSFYTKDIYGNWFKSPYMLEELIYGNLDIIVEGSLDRDLPPDNINKSEIFRCRTRGWY